MKLIKDFLKGIDLKNAIVAGVVAIVLTALYSWLSSNRWMEFFKSHLFTINISIARVSVFIIIVTFFMLTLSSYINKYRKLEIISAKYGVEGSYIDVTSQVKEMVSGNKINSPLNNGITGGFDPAEHIPKHAIIKYKYGNKEFRVRISETDRIIIPS